MANQIWQFRAFPAPDGEASAVKFLNEPLRQGRGEASGTLRNNGTAGLLWLEPGSLGEGTEQTWQSAEFPAPNGEAAAVNFLNEPLRQGRGEASVTLRNDGTAGLLWLEPRSLGDSTAQTRQFQEVPGPNGEQAAGGVLNERAPPARGWRSQRVRTPRRLRRDLLPRAWVWLIPASRGRPGWGRSSRGAWS